MEFSPQKNLSSTGEYGDIHHTHRHLIRNSLKTQLSPLRLVLPEGGAASPVRLGLPVVLDSFLTSNLEQWEPLEIHYSISPDLRRPGQGVCCLVN